MDYGPDFTMTGDSSNTLTFHYTEKVPCSWITGALDNSEEDTWQIDEAKVDKVLTSGFPRQLVSITS